MFSRMSPGGPPAGWFEPSGVRGARRRASLRVAANRTAGSPNAVRWDKLIAMMTTASQSDVAIARVRVLETGAERFVAGVPGSSYELHLVPTAPVRISVGRRTKGMIRLSVWKVDFVSAGGEYIEPIIGRPRRVQGKALGVGPGDNSIIIEVLGTPFVAELPERWQAAEITPGTRIGVEVYPGATFDPLQQ